MVKPIEHKNSNHKTCFQKILFTKIVANRLLSVVMAILLQNILNDNNHIFQHTITYYLTILTIVNSKYFINIY